MCKCLCCILQNLINAIKGINVSCDVPQPLEVTGDITTSIDIPQPLDITGSLDTTVSGNVTSTVSGTITANIPQPLEITGTINTVSTNACTEAMAKILGQSSSFNEIVMLNGEQFQNAENVTVDGSIVSFTSQNQKIQTTLCNVEYVVL